jgi:hypothetical protein
MQCHAFSAYSKAQQGARVECHDRSSFFGEKKNSLRNEALIETICQSLVC